MSYKIAFRFERINYSPTSMSQNNARINGKIKTLLDEKGINYSHIYEPSRNSIKAIFPTEIEVDKIFKHEKYFIDENFTPKMSLEMKANRTVFCKNLDPSIIATFSKEDITTSIQEQE